ncbi:MAG: ArsR family transcriptional regulator [Methanoregula sp.]|nr:ArsR family transcriptional regulator [Methanoregula sp.]
MKTETIQYFSEKDDEFVNLLIDIGIKKNIAKLLVFLASVPEASSRSLEHGTDMRQPEISVAMKVLIDKGWANIRGSSAERIGRPTKIYQLAIPVKEILDLIEEEKKSETQDQLALIRKLRDPIQ